MQLKRKVMAWSMAATAGLVTVFAAPSAAQAAFADCPSDRYCLWADPDGGGYGIWATTDLPDLRVTGLDDSVSSLANFAHTSHGRGLCIYPDLNYDGEWTAYLPAGFSANLTDPAVDDHLTSVRWAPSDSPPTCFTSFNVGKAGKEALPETRVIGTKLPIGG
ncbi:peptidase inhibitor family I36 protein [Actinoplanes sp. NPDC051470]|uniref:peptidase inhibitor family I36 protein n=1 Tax=Actinoplanes sp. NPDC051470 TaxID=3157224 RepID=UPI00343D735E